MNSDDCEVVGEHFLWHRATSEIQDIRDGGRRPDSQYDAKLDVYEDRVRTWFLDIAAQHTKAGSAPGDYVAVAVVMAYVEGVEQYRRGASAPASEAGAWFKASASRIFPQAPPETIRRLWKAVRCGLFHSGFTEGPTLLSHDHKQAVEVSGQHLRINPERLVVCVVEDFSRYMQELRASPDGQLAKNFARLWDRRWEET